MNTFNFKSKVLERSSTIPVLVEFSAPGCGPCWWMEKTLVEITKNNEGRFEFISLPLKDCESCIEEYKITSNPTTILFINGIEAGRLKASLPKIAIEQWLNDLLPTPDEKARRY